MASITQRIGKDGKISFLIRVTNGFDQNKKRIILTKTYIPTAKTPTKAYNEAKRFADDWEEDLKAGKLKGGCTIKFKDFADEWYNSWAKKNLEASTSSSYKELIDRWAIPSIGSLALMDIQKAHIQNIFIAMEKGDLPSGATKTKKGGLAMGSIKRAKSALNSVFSYALDGRHLITENPCDVSIKYTVTKVKKSTKVYNVFDQEQYKRFLAYLKKRLDEGRKNFPTTPIFYQEQDLLLFAMAIYGGFRRGELLALTWNDIDFNKGTVSISKSLGQVKGETIIKEPKTASGVRIVDMPKAVMNMLKEWKMTVKKFSLILGTDRSGNRLWQGSLGKDFDSNFVFISLVYGHYGKNLDMNTPGHKIRSLVKEYNAACEDPDQELPKLCFHDLRHTHVTDLIAKGVQIDKISRRVGHKDIYVTLTVYAHYLKNEDDHSISDLFENVI